MGEKMEIKNKVRIDQQKIVDKFKFKKNKLEENIKKELRFQKN